MKNKTIIKLFITLSVFIAATVITYTIKHFINNEDDPEYVDTLFSNNFEKQADSISVNKPLNEVADSLEYIVKSEESLGGMPQLDVSIGKYVIDMKNQTYSFNVILNELPNGAITVFYLCDVQKTDTISINQDGRFKNIKPIIDEEYRLLITWTDSVGNIGLTFDSIIGGFKPIAKPIIKKLEISELEQYINSCDRILTRPNKQIVSNLRFNFTNINGEENVPETIDEIYNKIKFGKWLSIKVVSVDYDADNKLKSVSMTINHNVD